MRMAVSFLMLAALLGACGGGGGDATPTPAPTATPEPSALAIWQTTLASLESVTSVRAKRTADTPQASFEAVFPRDGEPDDPSLSPWRGHVILPLFPGAYYRSTLPSLTSLRVLGQETLDGRPHWVLGFSAEESGIDTIQYFDAKAWIDRETQFVSKLETVVTDVWPYGTPSEYGRVIVEYSDYEVGTPATPTPDPTATPPPFTPPVFRLEPASGACNERVTLVGSGIGPYAFVNADIGFAFLSEHGYVTGAEIRDARADEDGDLSVTFQPLDDWCASPEVALRRTLAVSIRARLNVRAENQWWYDDKLEYRIEPCVTLGLPPVQSEAFCYNTAPPSPTATPTPR